MRGIHKGRRNECMGRWSIVFERPDQKELAEEFMEMEDYG